MKIDSVDIMQNAVYVSFNNQLYLMMKTRPMNKISMKTEEIDSVLYRCPSIIKISYVSDWFG